MSDRRYDQLLRIKTVGIREVNETSHHRYEATPYVALDKLFQVYQLKKTDHFVDFGCGRGRVAFYIHYHFHLPVTGIEANDETFAEALDNKERYRLGAKHINAPIHFEFGLAEDYEVTPMDNCFYFFNPFSVHIFAKVVQNILRSVKKRKRPVELILYYPLPEYKRFLKENTPFQLLNKVRAPGPHGKYGKFLIYRYA